MVVESVAGWVVDAANVCDDVQLVKDVLVATPNDNAVCELSRL